ncbi:MAG: hypothetical protein ACE15C_04040 [Phycisphaerae bacterium]
MGAAIFDKFVNHDQAELLDSCSAIAEFVRTPTGAGERVGQPDE